jgi:hypothetical protein
MNTRKRATRQLVGACLSVLAVVRATNGTAWAESAPPEDSAPTDTHSDELPAEDERTKEARAHFELGVSHFDHGEWESALEEFTRSRELIPTRRNTKNVAVCLRKVGRLDEALEMFERLLQDFPDLPPGERALVAREIDDLERSVGAIEIVDAPAEAAVSIDGTERGKTPLPRPLRLSAGVHALGLTKPGWLPFEVSVEVMAGRAAQVRAPMTPLLRETAAAVDTSDRPEQASALPLALEVRGGPSIGAVWGGALVDSCGNDCEASPPVGVFGEIHLLYRTLPSLGLGVCAGYLRLSRALNQRSASFSPVRRDEPIDDPGLVHDTLRLEGFTIAAEGQYVTGEAWPLTLRLEIGVLMGSLTDDRSGTFASADAQASSDYAVKAIQRSDTTYFLVGPELRILRRLGARFSLDLGLKVLFATALSTPRWSDDRLRSAGSVGAGQFSGALGQSLAGSLLVLAMPGVGVTYSF